MLKTEAAIVDAMERLMSGRTTFLITHRPSTLRYCDAVLRLEHGCVVAFEQKDRVTAREVTNVST